MFLIVICYNFRPGWTFFFDMMDDERDFKLRNLMKARRNDWFFFLSILWSISVGGDNWGLKILDQSFLGTGYKACLIPVISWLIQFNFGFCFRIIKNQAQSKDKPKGVVSDNLSHWT